MLKYGQIGYKNILVSNFWYFEFSAFFCNFFPIIGQSGQKLDKNGRNGPKNENFKNVILKSFYSLFVHTSAKFGVSGLNIPGGVAILVVFLKSQLKFQSAVSAKPL